MSFQNLNPEHQRPSLWEVFRWSIWDRLTGRRSRSAPGPPASLVVPDLELIHAESPETRVTWIGHASFLATIAGCHVLIDPVFATKIGGFYRRHGSPGLTISELPEVHLLLVTHNHYDHLDAPSIAAVPRSATVVCPLGLGRWFQQFEFARIVELKWWETFAADPLRVTLTPSRHWSRRGLWDTNQSLWGGYVIEHAEGSLYHAGDSAWCDTFLEVGRRFPSLDLAMISIGGYEPTWFMERNHLNPEQAGQAFLDCGARRLIPMHYGAFQLTDEPLVAPIDRLTGWWQKLPPELREQRLLSLMSVGETLVVPSSRA
ncbi:MAG: MBL fold metallo-hydrolase [Planctomycetaceae bacterium]